ncbi:hypothetical protein B0H14DRAFT_3601020 [Mycena olivaceomarginata]|nr:hypothetical protein B0H14DRAFT_3601020 [Mycena olivaceomarginata]
MWGKPWMPTWKDGMTEKGRCACHSRESLRRYPEAIGGNFLFTPKYRATMEVALRKWTSGIIGWRAAGAGGRTSIKTWGISDLRRRSTAWNAWLEALRGGDASGGTGKQKLAPAKQKGKSVGRNRCRRDIDDAWWEHTWRYRSRRGCAVGAWEAERILDASESAEATVHGTGYKKAYRALKWRHLLGSGRSKRLARTGGCEIENPI